MGQTGSRRLMYRGHVITNERCQVDLSYTPRHVTVLVMDSPYPTASLATERQAGKISNELSEL